MTRTSRSSTLFFSISSLLSYDASTAFIVESHFGLPNTAFKVRPPSTLGVSELHIPGYAQTKLPFILKDDDLVEEGSSTATRLETQQYSSTDYDSLVPHQSGNLLHKTKGQILSSEECRRIVDEAERVAANMGWTKSRHGNYPTTDIPIVELPETLKFLRRALVERIYPLLTSQFGEFLPDASKLRVVDGFVVKYDASGGQTELKPHRDGSVVSFNIALNPSKDFDGGGTWFDSLNDAVRINEGEIVSHASGILHGGHGITRGKRYILVAFVILEGYDSWSMRFYNQVRNL
jgi:hypothetical protein